MKKKDYSRINQFNRENYDRLSVFVPKGEKEVLQEKAKAAGLSLNGFILKCLKKGVDNP